MPKTARPAKTSSAKKRKARPQSPSGPPLRQRVLRAGMELCAEKGWRGFELEDVARRLRVKPADVRALCPDKLTLLRLLSEEVDAAMLAEPLEDDGSPVRDVLFELFMRRFDALTPWRDGVVALVTGWPANDPLLPVALQDTLRHSMVLTLESAGLAPTPWRIAGLGLVAAVVLKTWCADDSADMSRTMSALDRRLEQIERAAMALEGFCPRRNG